MAYNPHNKRKKRSNYFSRNIDKSGEDFLQFKNPQDLYRESAQIFRDFAMGNIDIPDYEKYFREPQFLEILILQAWTKYEFHMISATGVNVIMSNIAQFPQMELNKVTGVYNSHNSSASAYVIIYNFLTEFKMQGDITRLTVMCGQLRAFREYI